MDWQHLSWEKQEKIRQKEIVRLRRKELKREEQEAEREKQPDHEHYFVFTDEGLLVCELCGIEDEAGRMDYRARFRTNDNTDGGNGKSKGGSMGLPSIFKGHTYIAEYHTNERLAQVTLQGPRVPNGIMFILHKEYQQGRRKGIYPDDPNDLTKKDIALLCKNCYVPPIYREIYRSKKLKFNQFTTCTTYAERWYYIKIHLGGSFKGKPKNNELTFLKINCLWAQNQWNFVRHVDTCTDPGVDCHLRFGCRKNFPNIYYVMTQLCVLLGYDHLLPLFPVYNKQETVDKLNSYWKLICQKLGWTYIPLKVKESPKRKKKRTLKRGSNGLMRVKRRRIRRRYQKTSPLPQLPPPPPIPPPTEKKTIKRHRQTPTTSQPLKKIKLRVRRKGKRKRSKKEEESFQVHPIGSYFLNLTEEGNR